MAASMKQAMAGLALICIWMGLSVLGCSPRASPSQPRQLGAELPQPRSIQSPQQQVAPEQPEPEPQQGQHPQVEPQQPLAWPAQPGPQPQPPPDAINPVGIWESQIMTGYGVMYTQMILQPNGNYSYQVVLGDLMTWEVGFYEVGQGFIHFSLRDYGPKTYKTTELSRPMSWTVFYTVVDENTMIWEDRVLGTQWTVYRRR